MNWLLDRCIYCETRRIFHWIRKGKFNEPSRYAYKNFTRDRLK